MLLPIMPGQRRAVDSLSSLTLLERGPDKSVRNIQFSHPLRTALALALALCFVGCATKQRSDGAPDERFRKVESFGPHGEVGVTYGRSG